MTSVASATVLSAFGMLGASLSSSAQLMMAVIFASSAFAKIRSPRRFEAAVRRFNLVPAGLSRTVALLVPSLEFAAALALLTSTSSLSVAVSVALLILFTASLISALAANRAIECGCSGVLGSEDVSWHLVGRNAALLGVIAVAARARQPLIMALPQQPVIIALGASLLLFMLAAGTSMSTLERRRSATRRLMVQRLGG